MTQQFQYRKTNSKEYNKLVQSLPKLHEVAKYVKGHFIGRKVIYCTETNRLELYFSETNFMHLCGLQYQKGSGKFFNDCLDNRVDVDKLKVKKDGTTVQKLQVIQYMTELTSPFVRLTGSGKYLYLEFDHALRTKRQILALTLKDTTIKSVPQSLLDLKRQKSFPSGEPVEYIYAIDFKTNEKIVYFDKNKI